MQLFDDERTYRPDEVAAKLKINIKTVYRNINDIEDPLPAFRIKAHGKIRLSGSDLNRYFEKHTIKTWRE